MRTCLYASLPTIVYSTSNHHTSSPMCSSLYAILYTSMCLPDYSHTSSPMCTPVYASLSTSVYSTHDHHTCTTMRTSMSTLVHTPVYPDVHDCRQRPEVRTMCVRMSTRLYSSLCQTVHLQVRRSTVRISTTTDNYYTYTCPVSTSVYAYLSTSVHSGYSGSSCSPMRPSMSTCL